MSNYPLPLKKKRRVRRRRVYGYDMDEAFLAEYAKDKPFVKPESNYINTLFDAYMYIHQNFGCLPQHYIVKSWTRPTAEVNCVAIAHNLSPKGIQMATPERIERLQKVVGVDYPPRWLELLPGQNVKLSAFLLMHKVSALLVFVMF